MNRYLIALFSICLAHSAYSMGPKPQPGPKGYWKCAFRGSETVCHTVPVGGEPGDIECKDHLFTEKSQWHSNRIEALKEAQESCDARSEFKCDFVACEQQN